VVYGAPFDLNIEGEPPGSTWRLAAGKTFTLHAGQTLHIGGTPTRLRAYVCIHGGIDAGSILDSRSALKPLQAGDKLRCQPGVIGTRWIEDATISEEHYALRFLDGPQADWFGADELRERQFTVTPASNRMGLRLRGEPIALSARELLSEPVCPGSVQVTRDGQCIILGVDGQTIGGYAKIAQVISADLDHIGQMRPGESVAFSRVTLDEAEAAYQARRAELQEWLTRLGETWREVWTGNE
jgi:antagonist of KipI